MEDRKVYTQTLQEFNSEEIGRNLKSARMACKLSALEVESKTGIARQTIWKYEHGRLPRFDVLVCLSYLYQTPISKILEMRPKVEEEIVEKFKNAKSFGVGLREIRLAKGFSVSEVAQLIGVARQGYYLYESDDIYAFSLDRVVKLSEIFGISWDTIAIKLAQSHGLQIPQKTN